MVYIAHNKTLWQVPEFYSVKEVSITRVAYLQREEASRFGASEHMREVTTLK